MRYPVNAKILTNEMHCYRSNNGVKFFNQRLTAFISIGPEEVWGGGDLCGQACREKKGFLNQIIDHKFQ